MNKLAEMRGGQPLQERTQEQKDWSANPETQRMKEELLKRQQVLYTQLLHAGESSTDANVTRIATELSGVIRTIKRLE